MDIIKIAICDDELVFLEKLYDMVERIMTEHNYLCEIIDFDDSREFISHCRKNHTDIILADIDMPGKDGFEAICELQKQQPDISVIFVSAHEELAYRSFYYNPYQFVSKNDLHRLNGILPGLVQELSRKREASEIVYIFLGEKIVSLNVNKVAYLKSDKNYIAAHDLSGRVLFKFRGALRNIISQLSDYGFIFIHKSYICNCRFIGRFERKKLILANGRTINVTRKQDMLDEAQQTYFKYIRDKRAVSAV